MQRQATATAAKATSRQRSRAAFHFGRCPTRFTSHLLRNFTLQQPRHEPFDRHRKARLSTDLAAMCDGESPPFGKSKASLRRHAGKPAGSERLFVEPSLFSYSNRGDCPSPKVLSPAAGFSCLNLRYARTRSGRYHHCLHSFININPKTSSLALAAPHRHRHRICSCSYTVLCLPARPCWQACSIQTGKSMKNILPKSRSSGVSLLAASAAKLTASTQTSITASRPSFANAHTPCVPTVMLSLTSSPPSNTYATASPQKIA